MATQIDETLEKWLVDARKVVLAGVGNPIRSDDFVGTKIVQALEGKVSSNVRLIECETVPESHLFDIEQFAPSHVLIIDAAILGLEPGEAKLLQPEQVAGFSAISSHMLPLRVFSDYLRESTSAKIALLLIEPKNVEFGEDLSVELETASKHLAGLLQSLLSKI